MSVNTPSSRCSTFPMRKGCELFSIRAIGQTSFSFPVGCCRIIQKVNGILEVLYGTWGPCAMQDWMHQCICCCSCYYEYQAKYVKHVVQSICASSTTRMSVSSQCIFIVCSYLICQTILVYASSWSHSMSLTSSLVIFPFSGC